MSKKRGHDVLGMNLDMSSLIDEVDREIGQLDKVKSVEGVDGPKAKPQSVEGVDGYIELDTNSIKVWSFANRQQWEMNLDPLVESINRVGQLQPVRVRRVGDGYELIFGRRRFEACKLAGIPVKALVVKASDSEAYAMQQTENDDRVTISLYSECVAHKKALDEGVFPSMAALAVSIGKERTALSALVNAFANLPAALVDAIGDMGRVSFTTARVINKALKDNPKCLELIIGIASQLRAGQGSSLIAKTISGYIAEPTKRIVKVGDREVYSVIKSKKGEVTVALKKSEDIEKIEALILAFYETSL